MDSHAASVRFAKLLTANYLEKLDENSAVGEVREQVVDLHSGLVQIGVAPLFERFFLDVDSLVAELLNSALLEVEGFILDVVIDRVRRGRVDGGRGGGQLRVGCFVEIACRYVIATGRICRCWMIVGTVQWWRLG